jgi:hypothetical protein
MSGGSSNAQRVNGIGNVRHGQRARSGAIVKVKDLLHFVGLTKKRQKI